MLVFILFLQFAFITFWQIINCIKKKTFQQICGIVCCRVHYCSEQKKVWWDFIFIFHIYDTVVSDNYQKICHQITVLTLFALQRWFKGASAQRTLHAICPNSPNLKRRRLPTLPSCVPVGLCCLWLWTPMRDWNQVILHLLSAIRLISSLFEGCWLHSCLPAPDGHVRLTPESLAASGRIFSAHQ